jgi:fructokinase
VIYAGVELGGTKCVAILARGPDEVLAREVVSTTMPEETLVKIDAVLRAWKSDPGFGALGIASFGPIDLDPQSRRWGNVLATPKPGWAGADVAARLRDGFAVPIAFDTDVNGAALAEMHWGSGRDLRDVAYITVGTGIGVGLIVDGKPTRGFGHCELGHIRVARLSGDDWAGSCPYHGDCVEGLASGSSLEARFGEEAKTLGADHPVWDSVAWTLAQLCQAIVCAAAPRRIAVGGGVVEQQPHLLGRIQPMLADSLNGFIELPGPDYVCAPELGSDAGPLGAIALAMTATR